MSLSEWFDDEDIVSQLRSFFDGDDVWNIDFEQALTTVEEVDDDTLSVMVKDRRFVFDKVVGDVEEIV